MFETIDEITQLVKDKEAEFQAGTGSSTAPSLHDRMEADFELLTLEPYQPKDMNGNVRKGYQAFTTSKPRNFFDKILDGVNRAEMILTIETEEDAGAEEKKKASLGELFLFGLLERINRRLQRRGEPPLRESLAYWMCARGWYALRVLIYKSAREKEPVVDVLPWDPMRVTWEMSGDGLLWAAHKRLASAAQVLAEYDIATEGKTAYVIDFWDKDINAVVVDSVWGKEPTPHDIGHPPVLIGAVGSMPSMQRKDYTGTIEHRGDSVWASSRGLYEPWNHYVSLLMDIAEAGMVGSMVWETEEGNKVLPEGDPFRNRQILQIKAGVEKLSHLELPKAPLETSAIVRLISDDIQQGTLPYPLAYGGTEESMSGRALAFLGDQTRSVYTPYSNGLALAYTWMCEELLSQFKNKVKGRMTVQGYDNKQKYYRAEIKPSDINPNWFVSVTVKPKLPRDEETEINMANASTASRGPGDMPLLSKATARENILQLRDPQAEEDKILTEMGKALPPIQGARIVDAMRRRGDNESADLVQRFLDSQGMGFGGQPGMGAPPGPSAPPGQNGAQPGQEIIKAVLLFLSENGGQELAKILVESLRAGTVLDPQVIASVVELLMQAGQRELAQAFVALMSGGASAPAGGQGAPPPTGGPPAMPSPAVGQGGV